MFLEKSVCFFNTISNFLHRTMQTAKFEVIEAYDLVSSFFRNGSMTACFAWQPRFFGSEILVAFCPRNEIPEEFVLLASTDRCSVTTDFCNRTSGAGTVQSDFTAECRMPILACQGTRKAREVFFAAGEADGCENFFSTSSVCHRFPPCFHCSKTIFFR